jgi:hypothetical protein
VLTVYRRRPASHPTAVRHWCWPGDELAVQPELKVEVEKLLTDSAPSDEPTMEASWYLISGISDPPCSIRKVSKYLEAIGPTIGSVSPDGNRLVFGADDGSITIVDYNRLRNELAEFERTFAADD